MYSICLIVLFCISFFKEVPVLLSLLPFNVNHETTSFMQKFLPGTVYQVIFAPLHYQTVSPRLESAQTHLYLL